MAEQKFYCADAYNKAYLFHKKWANAENTDENWSKIVSEAEKIIRDTKTGIARNLIMTALEELETHICKKPDGDMGFAEYYIKLLKYHFNVKTNEELAKAIQGMKNDG